MARYQQDSLRLSCSICLDFLEDPVTVPCGHSYCMNCIKNHWDEEDWKRIHSCPQCRRTFTPRPVLEKNILLAELVEELKETGLKAAPAEHCYAGPEDVACDFCSDRKLKAIKSCMQCLASYCEEHIQPHYDGATFRNHKLVEPSKNLQENICSRHNEVMKIFCRTDQQAICYFCTMDEHRGHETVPATAETDEKKKEVQVRRLELQHGIQDIEKDVKVLQQEVEAISRSADQTVTHSEDIFTELIHEIQKRRNDVKQQVRSQQETEVSQVKDLQEKLEQRISEMKKKDAELEKLSHTEDPNQFLHNYRSLSNLSESTHSYSINTRTPGYFKNTREAVSQLKDKVQDSLRQMWTLPDPKTRADFLQYSRELTLDPNTAHKKLLICDGNRKAAVMTQPQSYPNHPDRFTGCWQVLTKESLTGRAYWEVEWTGEGGVHVAVSYQNISRAKGFGFNDKSWSLRCDTNRHIFVHNNDQTDVSGPPSNRIGVYLDHSAGTLSFYRVSETMTLLHRVQTTFTQPLHAGLMLFGYDAVTAEFSRFI